MKSISAKHLTLYVVLFSIAMAMVEAAVVVYLREIYYPDGFYFPLKLIPPDTVRVEYLREIATILMLLLIGVIAGRNFYTKFAYFLLNFGVWDIFYYVWLKILLDWPESLLTWDVLFLIPIIWVGPVLAPIICSLTMILLASIIIYYDSKECQVKINLLQWLLLIVGSLIILITFLWDFSKIIFECNCLIKLHTIRTVPEFQNLVANYIPVTYNWFLFVIGEILLLTAILLLLYKTRIKKIYPVQ